MLPTYTRLGTSSPFGRRALRTREKFLILLLFATLAFVCFGGLFYLPDNFVASDKVREVYKKIQSAGPEIFIPAPPVARAHHQHGIEKTQIEANNELDDAQHILHDRSRLAAKINDDFAAGNGDHLEKPQANEAPVMNPPSPENNKNDMSPAEGAVADAPDLQGSLPSGEDSDPVTRERRNKIREVSHCQKLWKNSLNFVICPK